MNEKITTDQVLEDYKRFLSIVSHDLKAPLRHLEFFTNSLFESIEEKTNEEDREKIDFIKKSMSRLKAMQNALLELSRIVASEEQPQEVNIQDLVEKIAFAYDDDKNIEINVSSLPILRARYNQLSMVFKALIENAIIYNDQDCKIISILAEAGANQVKFTVRDNGIGIVADHHDSIFDMFRRLHSASEYGGGVGAGLTISKSIIKLHGGDVSVSRNDGGGTDIVFTLPVLS